MLNSNGIDVKINEDKKGASLEYSIIGGVLDLYFFEGPDPVDAVKEYAKIAGLPAMIPYWSLGVSISLFRIQVWRLTLAVASMQIRISRLD